MNTYTRNQEGKSLCIYSYNSRGFAQDKQDLCKLLMSTSGNTYPVLCNQENFLLRSNGYKIKQCLSGAHVIFKEAIKDTHDNGRPKNGMFVAVPAVMKEYVEDISPNHWRVQAVLVRTVDNSIMIINTYFPTDPKSTDFDSSELMTTLSAIQDLLTRNDFNSVVWTGDINAEFSRRTEFTKSIESFIEENNFQRSWNQFQIDFTHVQDINGKSYTSTLDHFFWSENVAENVSDAGVLHLLDNLSDHCPVYCRLPISDLKNVPTRSLPKQVHKPSWSHASDEQKQQYVVNLEKSLKMIEVRDGIMSCNNVHCCEESHLAECDELILSILEIIDKTSTAHLTRKTNQIRKKKEPIPLWQTEIEPFKRDAQFWHSV